MLTGTFSAIMMDKIKDENQELNMMSNEGNWANKHRYPKLNKDDRQLCFFLLYRFDKY